MAVQPHHVHTLNMVQYARHMCSALHEVSEVTQALCNEFSVSIRTQVLYCRVLLRSSDTLCDGIDSGMSAGPRYSDWPRIKAQGRGRGKGGGGNNRPGMPPELSRKNIFILFLSWSFLFLRPEHTGRREGGQHDC